LLPDGRRQVTGFLSSGDFLGLAARTTYAYSAEAITEGELCRFRVPDLERLFLEFPEVRERLYDLANDELAAAQEQMLLLGRKTARERVVSFILERIERNQRQGENVEHLELPMNRSDIADYLGLTIETVSRTLTILKDDGLIDLPSPHHITVPDREMLARSARGSE
jgi:CRP/FNR family transcriptional regulator